MTEVTLFDWTERRHAFESRDFGSLQNQIRTQFGLKSEEYYLTSGSKILDRELELPEKAVLRLHLRLLGGKGGFGSMLRALGAQIEKTTNHEAMRDLSGRRVRDVNNEKALTDWLSKTAERERLREERRRERILRKKAQLEAPKHRFEDGTYHEAKAKVLENLDDAVEAGLRKTAPGNSDGAGGSDAFNGVSRKRKGDRSQVPAKKLFGLGDAEEEMETSSEEEEEGMEEPISEQGKVEERSGIEEREDMEAKPVSDTVDEKTSDASDVTESDQLDPGSTATKNEELSKEDDLKPVTVVESREVPPPPSLPLDLDAYSDVDALESLGLETLKAALTELGLKCGGTLEERAARLWSVRGKPRAEWDKALFAKGKGKGKGK